MAWYVKFDDIRGSSSDKLHFAWTNAAVVYLSGYKAGGGGTGVGRVGGRMHIEDVVVGIISDVSTSELLLAAVKERVFKKVTIHATAKRGDVDKVYLEVELKDAMITNYQIGVLDNNAATDDMSFTLNFRGYKSAFYDADGRGNNSDKVEYEWKVEE